MQITSASEPIPLICAICVREKKQIYPIYLISIPKTCRASISDTSDTSASLITSASEIICLFRVFRVQIKFFASSRLRV